MQYHDEDNDLERIKRQCLMYDRELSVDFKNPLHLIPYTITTKDGHVHVRYSLSEEYYKQLHNLAYPVLSNVNSREEEEFLREILDMPVPKIPRPIPLIFPLGKPKEPMLKSISETNLRFKILARLHALHRFFSGIIPSKRPECVSEENWSDLLVHVSNGTLLKFSQFSDEKIIVRSLPIYDGLVHAETIAGECRDYTISQERTRFRWWSDVAIIGFNPIRNLKKDRGYSGFSIGFPPAILNNVHLLELYNTLQHQKLAKAISDLILMYIEKLIGRDTYEKSKASGFKKFGLLIKLRQLQSSDCFIDIVSEYFK